MTKGDEADEVICPECNGKGRVKASKSGDGSEEGRLFHGKPIPASRLW